MPPFSKFAGEWLLEALAGVARIGVLLLLTALGGLALIRYAPGFLTDEQQFDPRLSGSTIEAMRTAKAQSYWALSGRFLADASRGDFGVSEVYGYPVSQLILERAPVTMRCAGAGLGLAWVVALALVAVQVLTGKRWLDWAALGANQLTMVVPSGLIAFCVFLAGAPALVAIAVIVYPQIYRNVRELVIDAWSRPHVLAARARGSSPMGLLLQQVLPVIAAPLVAMLGTSVALGLGASIPVEALGDFPGLGQLTWKAATARDLPLLMPLVLVVAAVALTANWMADLMLGEPRLKGQAT